MAYEQIIPGAQLSVKAYATHEAKQYHAVKLDTAHEGYFATSGANEAVLGILQDAPAAGQKGSIMTMGVSKAVMGGTTTVGDNLRADASGHLVTAGGGEVPVAVALEAATAANDIRPVLMLCRTAAGTTSAEGEKIIRIPLTGITTAADLVTGIPFGRAGTIKDMYAFVETADDKTGKAATLYCKIGTTAVTGAEVVLTSATCTPALNVIASTGASSATNTFAATDTLKISAKTVTSFTGSAGVIEVHVITG